MIDRIRSATHSIFQTRLLANIALQSVKNSLAPSWQAMPNLSRVEKVQFLASTAFRSVLLLITNFSSRLAHAWSIPIAYRTRTTCDRLLREQNLAFRSRTLSRRQAASFSIQLARVILDTVFDHVTIQRISTFAARMALYQLEEGNPVFKQDLEPHDIINLMNQRVPAVCVSYKHTRRSRDDLPTDVARVQRAVAGAASQLSQERLLFWCDVIGQTPQGDSWAEKGIDPYLSMPTLRIVSTELREEIDESFWMTVDRMAALTRGGMISYDEGDARLRFRSPEGYNLMYLPYFLLPFEMAKMWVARLICNPILYYRRARYEDDKLEVMKYAISVTISGRSNLYGLRQNGARLLELGSDQDNVSTFAALGLERDNYLLQLPLSRPHKETNIREGECWHGWEECFPALQLFEPQDRELINSSARETGLWIRVASAAVDNVTEVLCAQGGNNAWCSVMRLRVAGFEEHEDRVTGRVVSFRVATQEEELSVTAETSIHKQVCFH